MRISTKETKVQTKPKSTQESTQGSIDSNWLPADPPVIKKMNILMIIDKFRLSTKPINLEKYDNLAVRQPMQHKNLPFVYQGTWKNDTPEGYGIFYYNSGLYYEGYITNGELNGMGLLILENQQYYYGDFEKNRPSGNVIFEGLDVKFKGNLIEGEELVKGLITCQKEGTRIIMHNREQGIIEYDNGAKYEGYIMNRYPCGRGKLTLPNGNTYEGDMFNNKFNGFGTYTWKQGCKYQGKYKDNDKHGLGKFYHTADIYQQCDWNQGLKVGSTKLYHKGRLIYTGVDKDKIAELINKMSCLK